MSRRFDGWGGAALAACVASLGGDARADAPRAATGTLFVTANGFEGTRGRAIVAVYANKESWLKIDKAYRVQNIAIAGPTVVARFPEMPPGVYAVSVIHDANSNGKISRACCR